MPVSYTHLDVYKRQDERLKKAQRIGLTPEEVSTLASIVEEETANGPEKMCIRDRYIPLWYKHIARNVFYDRWQCKKTPCNKRISPLRYLICLLYTSIHLFVDNASPYYNRLQEFRLYCTPVSLLQRKVEMCIRDRYRSSYKRRRMKHRKVIFKM